jgi:phosphatidylserine/phosphatidylglycerophosphate/cardiolipin synthase-like enzyme
VAEALRDAARRGVAVRVAYNADHDERVFPPPPRTKPELLERLPFPTLGIPGIPDLLHHKCVVRDGEAVWMGSANWTTDSWTVQENVLIVTRSAEVAGEFGRNFEELWKLRDVDKTGRGGVRPLEIGGREARAWFTPGRPPDATPAGAPSPDARPAGAPGGEPQTGGSPVPPPGRP